MTPEQEAPPTSTSEQKPPAPGPLGPLARYEQGVIDRIADFNDPRQEWRRLFSELVGTFFLVLVAAGGGMMGHAFPGVISRTAAVVAPALMVMAIILFMGKVSGAHLNPAVSIAFALRRDFPWRRVPGYILVQLIGATLAALFLRAVINVSSMYGSNYPAHGYSDMAAFWMELILTVGLVSVILGHSLRGAEHRYLRCLGGGRLHRPRRAVGQSHLGRLHEPGSHVRARPRQHNLHQLLGLRRRSDRRRRDCGRHRLRAARPGGRQVRRRGSARRPVYRGVRSRQVVSARLD